MGAGCSVPVSIWAPTTNHLTFSIKASVMSLTVHQVDAGQRLLLLQAVQQSPRTPFM